MIKLENNQISFVLITLAYWFFMLTDGALRMIVLLHFHILGFTPLQLAYLFLLYEFLGMITNLTAGWIAKKFGLNKTLFAGIILQILSFADFISSQSKLEHTLFSDFCYVYTRIVWHS